MAEEAAERVGLDNHREALSAWLDLFRWTAAFAVLVFHVRHRLFMPMGEMPAESKTLLFYAVGTASSLGGQAVMVFFVLSGFLVGGSSLRRFRRDGRFDLREYTISRLTRLWIVLIPIFVLSYVLVRLGAGQFGGVETGVYDPTVRSAAAFAPLGAGTFACNVAFLQTALCQQYADNGALWSLFNEFWYYMAWPLVLLAFWSRLGLAARAGLLGIVAVVLGLLVSQQFIGANLPAYFLLWLLGVLAADRDRPLLPIGVIGAAFLFVATMAASRIWSASESLEPSSFRDYPLHFLMALAFANLILTMRTATALRYPPLRRIHASLAGFSFSLYCIHTSVANCFAAFLTWSIGTGWHMNPVGALPYLLYAATILVCLMAAYAFAALTELHTTRVRDRILGRHPAPARAAA